MITPLGKNYKGLISITGPTRSGKSQLAEFLIKKQQSVTYIATSKPRPNDPDWQKRIDLHKKRRPDRWKLIEHPKDICKVIESISENGSILIDSIGGLVEHHLGDDDAQWEIFQDKLLNCFTDDNLLIVVVSEEVGWGIVPATPIGHLFRERHSTLTSLLSCRSKKKLLAINGIAIDLDPGDNRDNLTILKPKPDTDKATPVIWIGDSSFFNVDSSANISRADAIIGSLSIAS